MSDRYEIVAVVLFFAVIILLVATVPPVATKTEWNDFCMNHGYAEAKKLRGEWYCIDYLNSQPSRIATRDDLDDDNFPPHVILEREE